jgi:hypothetical protein
MGSATTVRTGLTSSEIKQAFRDNLRAGLGRLETFATKHDLYVALALTMVSAHASISFSTAALALCSTRSTSPSITAW